MTGVRMAASSMIAMISVALGGTTAFAQTTQSHHPHAYSKYEQMILRNVSQFHKTFNAHQFVKNGELVADDLHTNSNGTEIVGRDAFVKRISRFVEPFPDVKITDIDTVVDGNMAMVRYVITGTQKGDLPTPEGVIKATGRAIRVDGTETFTFDQRGKLTNLVTIERGDQLIAQLKGH